MPRPLDSIDELIGRPVAGRDPDEDERYQEFANEAEKEKALDCGWWLSCPVASLPVRPGPSAPPL